MQRTCFNAKRRLQLPAEPGQYDLALAALSGRVRYVGSPHHKRGPGDFGLNPPAALRLGKSICDDVVNCKADAQALLVEGTRRGLISRQVNGGYPQNIWAVTTDGIPLEVMLDNAQQGTYHGYPMPEGDPLRTEVLERWRLWRPAL